MQRTIGKRIFAVVAGVGLVAGSAAIAVPTAQASFFDEFYWESEKFTIGDDAADRRQKLARDAQKLECLNQGYEECYSYGYTDWNDPAYTPGSQYYDVEGWKWIFNPDSDNGDLAEEAVEAQEAPEPAPCWSTNNCPVGGAIRAGVPEYMIAGVPQQVVVYASWRPDENTKGEPSNGDAVLSINGEPAASAPFVDGVATLRFTPTIPGLKTASISGVLNSNTSGANAWIDTIEVSTMVLPYDPEALEAALKNKKVEVGQTYTLQEIAQAKTALGKRLEWRVAQDSSDVCAVTTTKKGEVRAKFTESGKCSIIWTDPKKDEEGKYTFKVTA